MDRLQSLAGMVSIIAGALIAIFSAFFVRRSSSKVQKAEAEVASTKAELASAQLEEEIAKDFSKILVDSQKRNAETFSLYRNVLRASNGDQAAEKEVSREILDRINAKVKEFKGNVK